MTRAELEHIIRASGEIAQVKTVFIFGSQAILATAPSITNSNSNTADALSLQSYTILLRSMEADIMIPGSQEKTDLVEAAIGELSQFHNTYGYYVQGVDLTTSTLPEGWRNRLVNICNENTNGISGLCLEIHDLIIAKLYAGRRKDVNFFKAAVNLGLLSKRILLKRLLKTNISEKRRLIIKNIINRGFGK